MVFDRRNHCIYNGYIMKTVLNIKTDVEVKERAQALAKHLGIPLSTIVNANLKAFIETVNGVSHHFSTTYPFQSSMSIFWPKRRTTSY